MKNVGLVAEMLMKACPPTCVPVEQNRQRARAIVAATLLELARGNIEDAGDIELAKEWADHLVEALIDYAVARCVAEPPKDTNSKPPKEGVTG